MFGGIINDTGRILEASLDSNIYTVRITKPKKWNLKRGQSISIDGICSTVSLIDRKFFEVQYVPETYERTTALLFKKNVVVNLERSITLKTLLDGHVISGHVDGIVSIKKLKREKKYSTLTVSMPYNLMHLIVPQGSIALNGVSLTVQNVSKNSIVLALIPETLRQTNLVLLDKGLKANIEVDMLARYIYRATLEPHAKKTLRKKKKTL